MLRIVNRTTNPKRKRAARAAEQMRLREWPTPALEASERDRLVSSMGCHYRIGMLSFAMDSHIPASSRGQKRPLSCGGCAKVSWVVCPSRGTLSHTIFASVTSAQLKWGFTHFS